MNLVACVADTDVLQKWGGGVWYWHNIYGGMDTQLDLAYQKHENGKKIYKTGCCLLISIEYMEMFSYGVNFYIYVQVHK